MGVELSNCQAECRDRGRRRRENNSESLEEKGGAAKGNWVKDPVENCDLTSLGLEHFEGERSRHTCWLPNLWYRYCITSVLILIEPIIHVILVNGFETLLVYCYIVTYIVSLEHSIGAENNLRFNQTTDSIEDVQYVVMFIAPTHQDARGHSI